MRRVVALVALVASVIGLAFAAEFWNSKPYTKWSQSDAMHLLTESPWAKTITLRNGTASASPRTTGGPQGVEDSREEAMIRYTVFIPSSLPVRQANARLAAISGKYDKMDAAAKQQFDDQWSKTLEHKFDDVIVVAVHYESNDPSMLRQLATFFQAQTLDTMKGMSSMSFSDGKKEQPTAFANGQREFRMAFPRPASPLPANGWFSVDFQHPGTTNLPAQAVNTRFQLKDMMFNGSLSY